MNFKFLISVIIMFFSFSVFANDVNFNLEEKYKEVRNEFIKNKKLSKNYIENNVSIWFDFNTMSKMALGKNWRNISESEGTQFTNEFKKMLMHNYTSYAQTFMDYDLKFSAPKLSDDKETAVFKIKAYKDGQTPLDLEYCVKKVDDNWLIYDVKIEGLSIVLNYRNMFDVKIKKSGGIGGVIKMLKETNQKNA